MKMSIKVKKEKKEKLCASCLNEKAGGYIVECGIVVIYLCKECLGELLEDICEQPDFDTSSF